MYVLHTAVVIYLFFIFRQQSKLSFWLSRVIDWDTAQQKHALPSSIYASCTLLSHGIGMGVVIGVLTYPPMYVPTYRGEQLSHPDTRIVSLTVTEKGYCQDVNGDLDRVRACCCRCCMQSSPFQADVLLVHSRVGWVNIIVKSGLSHFLGLLLYFVLCHSFSFLFCLKWCVHICGNGKKIGTYTPTLLRWLFVR